MRYVLAKTRKESGETVIVYNSYEEDRGSSSFGEYVTSGFYFVPVVGNENEVPVVAIILKLYNEQSGWRNKIVALFTNPVTGAKEYKKLKDKFTFGEECMWNFAEKNHWLFAIKLVNSIVCV